MGKKVNVVEQVKTEITPSYECIYRFRDKSGNVLGYEVLSDDNGLQLYTPDKLKVAMEDIEFSNIKLNKNSNIRITGEECGKYVPFGKFDNSCYEYEVSEGDVVSILRIYSGVHKTAKERNINIESSRASKYSYVSFRSDKGLRVYASKMPGVNGILVECSLSRKRGNWNKLFITTKDALKAEFKDEISKNMRVIDNEEDIIVTDGDVITEVIKYINKQYKLIHSNKKSKKVS